MIGLGRTTLYSSKKSTSVLLFEESAFAITEKVLASVGKQGEQDDYCNHNVLCFSFNLS